MKVLTLTNEYPPHIYGGAGVHVAHLLREMTALSPDTDIFDVLCFGSQKDAGTNLRVSGVPVGNFQALELKRPKLADTLLRNAIMTGIADAADVIHCHTWYTYMAGCLLKEILQAPLVVTTHSLEPHRPWKRDQLGDSYHATCWLEKTAMENADGIIAVSETMKQNVMDLYHIHPEKIQVIYNGVDTRFFSPISRPDILRSYGIDPDRPYILFVGRITRQKGIMHLIRAISMVDPGVQTVLCASAPDTGDIAREMKTRVETARQTMGRDLLWLSETIPLQDLPVLYSHAAVFVCPSVYEPFGIINLEAGACSTPVVAAAVGGIPEVVVHKETGLLVPFDAKEDAEPAKPEIYAADLAAAINTLIRAPEKGAQMGAAARKRIENHFSWTCIAHQTIQFYQHLIKNSRQPDQARHRP
ncbi:MAG TPA: glycogen synthase [Desulfobacter sp.]|uniref:glycogen synthase n=1 Tax=Desulfobacter sp. UBA2225 TaxID=1961413 RepID=UPI000E964167|nr:glycogen synthase [Desulfobacter sp. UBA2225]HAR33764.1 glycogen synthase [Desulfobacter sp.]